MWNLKSSHVTQWNIDLSLEQQHRLAPQQFQQLLVGWFLLPL